VFYTVPSRLIRHRLRIHLYDDRLEVFLGGTALFTLSRGRAHRSGAHGHVVDYRHVIHALKRKPGALLGLVYRDALFPRLAYRQTFEFLLGRFGERRACRDTVALLALAHERACEAELAAQLDLDLNARRCPDLPALQRRFGPSRGDLPSVTVVRPSVGRYDNLLSSHLAGGV